MAKGDARSCVVTLSRGIDSVEAFESVGPMLGRDRRRARDGQVGATRSSRHEGRHRESSTRWGVP
jgi:hypothetical protein